LTVTLVAGVMPKSTAVAPVKLEPEMVTLVPPAVGPELGEIPVIVGGAAEVAKQKARAPRARQERHKVRRRNNEIMRVRSILLK
jgi:hypothetical protein